MQNFIKKIKMGRSLGGQEKNMKKAIIGGAFILGIILTVFAFQAITIYQLRTQVANDHTTLVQVVDFLNQNIQAQQKAVQGGNQQVQAPAPAKK